MGNSILCLFALVSTEIALVTAWSYHEVGHWEDEYPDCGKNGQSPINIETDDVIPDRHLRRFSFSNNFLQTLDSTLLENTGHGYQVNLEDDNHRMTGGSLSGDEYVLKQFHVHFGSKVKPEGSEHTLNGKRFPGEMHFVMQSDSVDSTQMGHLAVLGLFIDIDDDHPNTGSFDAVLRIIKHLKEHGDTASLDNKIKLSSILRSPKGKRLGSYYRYRGSLTTPPCSEIVEWTIFKDPIIISQHQYMELLQGVEEDGEELKNTYRPTQPLNGREVLCRGRACE